jgi:Protein of unknown function (DUF3768)
MARAVTSPSSTIVPSARLAGASSAYGKPTLTPTKRDSIMATTKTDQIRALNDELRQHLHGGLAVITPGVAALGQEAVERIVRTIAVYDDFCHANDPHEEHDFGAFDADGQKIFFKIDYFDKTLTYHSPDPSDPTVTERVITIMLAEEY